MAKKIAILNDGFGCSFEDEQYVVDLSRRFGGHTPGDLICRVHPFGGTYLPLELELAICVDGSVTFRKWEFTSEINPYLHTSELASDSEKLKDKPWAVPFIPTEAQIDTVNGLFSGRIRFEGLKIAVGKTVIDICPIDVKREERLIGKRIYLA